MQIYKTFYIIIRKKREKLHEKFNYFFYILCNVLILKRKFFLFFAKQSCFSPLFLCEKKHQKFRKKDQVFCMQTSRVKKKRLDLFFLKRRLF